LFAKREKGRTEQELLAITQLSGSFVWAAGDIMNAPFSQRK